MKAFTAPAFSLAGLVGAVTVLFELRLYAFHDLQFYILHFEICNEKGYFKQFENPIFLLGPGLSGQAGH
jgi:hypothetical protein